MPTSPKALDYVSRFEMLFECFVIKVKYSRLQALFLKKIEKISGQRRPINMQLKSKCQANESRAILIPKG